MKNYLVLIILIGLIPIHFLIGDTMKNDDEAKIKAAIHDYLEAWYTADVERMDRALDKDFVKRLSFTKSDGKHIYNSINKEDMMNYVKKGGGKKQAVEGWKEAIKIKIFEINKNIATAASYCKEYIDYIHLHKKDGEWKIIGVLWVPNR